MQPTIADVIGSRVTVPPLELLLAVADHFYQLGALQTPVPPRDRGLADLITLLEALYTERVLERRALAVGATGELPEWLTRLANSYTERGL